MPGSSWTRPGPSATPSPLHLSPARGSSPDTSDAEWMTYIQVDRLLRGKVKIPHGQPISCGGFSDVYKCDVRFDKSTETNPKMVAVKVLRRVGLNALGESEVLQKMIERASREVYAWSAIEHPNVVPLVGVSFTPVLSLISPWYEKGDLRRYLGSTPGANRLKLLLDIAKGLAYLHSLTPPVVHGDMKPENVLINDNGDALIMDFGLATVMEANPWYNSSHRQGGSVRWMAPELLLNQKQTRSCSSDTYSYGGVAFEVMTSELPHSGRSELDISLAISDPKKEPCDDWAKHPQVSEKIKEMIMKCWSRRSEKRPTMRAIEEGLGRLVDESLQNRG